jgi:hypothetical protein
LFSATPGGGAGGGNRQFRNFFGRHWRKLSAAGLVRPGSHLSPSGSGPCADSVQKQDPGERINALKGIDSPAPVDGGRQELALAAFEVALRPGIFGLSRLTPDGPMAGEASDETPAG